MSAHASAASRKPLLGALAATPWLRRHGEVLAVQAIALLLQEAPCRDALASWFETGLAIQIADNSAWRAEGVEQEGRPDLAAGSDPKHPQVLIEAKFDHALTVDQTSAYLDRLGRSSAPGPRGLVLLVPKHRGPRAESVLAEAIASRSSSVKVITGILTWDELLEAFATSAQGHALLAEDIRQLAAMCATYEALDILPFTQQELETWPPPRPRDLDRIIDRVTKRLNEGRGRLLPLGWEADDTGVPNAHYRRYVPFWKNDVTTHFSIGVRPPRAGTTTPIWLRYHTVTGTFSAIVERVTAAFPEAQHPAGGHLYLPLHIPTGLSGADIVDALETQVARYQNVAAVRPDPDAAPLGPDLVATGEPPNAPQSEAGQNSRP